MAFGRLKLLTGTVLAGLVLAGCHAAARHAEGPRHLRLTWGAGNPAESAMVTRLVQAFNHAHPGIVVELEPVGGAYYAKLLTMLASHTAPDVFVLDSSAFQPFLRKHVLRPLDDLVSGSTTHLADFWPHLNEAFTADAHTYGIPKDFNTLGLFYNRAMFNRAHLGYPDASWDLERLRAAAKQLTDPATGTYGITLTQDSVERFGPVAMMYGASVLTATHRSGLRSPEALAAMRYYTGLKLVDHAAILPSEVGSANSGDAFGKQNVAMGLEGGWMIPYLAETFPALGYGIAELPHGPRGRGNYLFTAAYVIPRDCPNVPEAWSLIQALTSESAQRQVNFALPSRRAIGEQYANQHPLYRALLAGAAYARPYELGPERERVMGRASQALQEIFLGVRGPEAALQAASDDIDQASEL